MSSPESYLILGGGPAGMAAAMELSRAGMRTTIVEKAGAVGGLAKTLEFVRPEGTYRTDIGPHRFFSKNKYLYDFIEDLLGEQWITVNRLTRFYVDGKYYFYPVRLGNVLGQMGPFRAARVLIDFLWEKLRKAVAPREIRSFEDYAVANFGRSLAEFNMLNYTEKIWGIPCTRISKDWALQRIGGLSIGATLKKMFMKKTSAKSLVDIFYYPEYGSGTIYEAIVKRIREKGSDVLTDSEPARIRWQDGRVTGVDVKTPSGTKTYDDPKAVISSVSVTQAVALFDPPPPQAVLDAAKALTFRSQVYLFLTVKKERVSRDNWVYFPDKSIPFGRFSEMKNFSEKMCPPGHTSLFVEYFCFFEDDIWNKSKDDLFELTIAWLDKLGFLKREDVTGVEHLKQRYVYPIYDLTYREHLDTVMRWLDGFGNLFAIGRPGRFRYTNQDHSLEMGILAARSVVDGRRHDVEDVGAEKEYFERGYVPAVGERGKAGGQPVHPGTEVHASSPRLPRRSTPQPLSLSLSRFSVQRAARWLLTLALLRLAAEYAVEVAYILRLPPVGYDNVFFWTVGRGIVNGLRPYIDLFETKPPGIFMLAAGSSWLTGSSGLGFLTQAAAILSIPGTVALIVYRRTRDGSRYWKTGLALAYAGLLGLYVSRHAGQFIPESFGVASLALYLAALASSPPAPVRFAALAISLFLAIGFKEPFLLSALAVAIAWSERPAAFIRDFLFPVAVALAAGAGLLFIAGWWEAYTVEYLGYMLGQHVHRTVPLWARGLEVGRLLSDLQGFSWLLRGLILGACALFLAEPVRSRWTLRGVRHVGWVIFAAAVLEAAINGFRLHQLLTGIVEPSLSHRYWVEVLSAAIPGMAAVGATAVILWLLLQGASASRVAMRLLRTFAAVYVATLAVGAAGDWAIKHFGFAVPLFLTLGVRFLVREKSARLVLLASCAVGLAVLLRPPLRDYPHDFALAATWADKHRGLSTTIDTLLDDCGPKRYMFLTNLVTAVPRHSPLGPLFQQGLIMDQRSQKLSNQTTANLRRADLVVHDGRPPTTLLALDRRRILQSDFVRIPWPCADGARGFGDWEFYFRPVPASGG